MKKLEVRYQRSSTDSSIVGWLAESNHKIYFEYAADFLSVPLWLSPFKLPPSPGVHEHKDLGFGPNFGLFDDSLPDGWGLLLMDRAFRKEGINPNTVGALDRLAFLGENTMGALTYHPSTRDEPVHQEILDLSIISQEVKKVWQGSVEEILPQLLRAGGSPGGARPKVLAGVKGDEIITAEILPEGYEHWMIKFTSPQDNPESGIIEYIYSQMAREAGINMPDTRLFISSDGDKFFGIKRFDRDKDKRFHVHTFGNLIHSNFRIPNCDYNELLKCVQILTKKHQDLLALFRQAVFNVAVHNRDDHVKNFAFTFDPDSDWSVTPAYDLTFSEGPGGEHSMMICGEGKEPSRQHILQLAKNAGIKSREAESIIEEVIYGASQWRNISIQHGLPAKSRDYISMQIELNIRRLK